MRDQRKQRIQSVFKDKLRHIKILRVYLTKNPLEQGSTKLQVVRSTPNLGAREKLLQRKGRSKVRKLLIHYKAQLSVSNSLSLHLVFFFFFAVAMFLGFFSFFLMWTILKVYIKYDTILFLFSFWVFWGTTRHLGSQLLKQGWNSHPLHWKAKS